jgi:transposase
VRTASANWVAAARLSAGGREPDRRGRTLAGRARRATDLTRDKSDPKDAVLIARLASELRCYEPERASAVWARLRHLGARRNQLTTGATAAVNQIRDLSVR